MNGIKNIKKYILTATLCFSLCFLSACDVSDYYTMQVMEEVNVSENQAEGEQVELSVAEDETKEAEEEVAETDEVIEPEEESLLPADMTDFELEKSYEYCTQPVCLIDENKEIINCSFRFKGKVPKSDDDYIYLFEMKSCENAESAPNDSSDIKKEPVASAIKAKEMNISLDYATGRLFSRYFPALLYEGDYVPLYSGQYITNPEILAENTCEYQGRLTKKGLLLDANTLDKSELYDLNVKRVLYNLPLSFITGETTSPVYPTTVYEYGGKEYQYDTYMLSGFDSLFKNLTDNGFHVTVIILNDWNEDFPEIMHPLSRRKTGRSEYYAFNTEEEDGTDLIEATAMFLAERYSGGEYGMVYDWVIANEVNQQAIWNYMNTDDIDYYTESFERGFRIFYNAIKSKYANANVYFSIDQAYNNNGGNDRWFFNGRDFLYKYNEIAKSRGNYDWGLSIHPYPKPLYNTKFWAKNYDKTEEAKVVTPMNLSAVTSLMTKPEFLDTNDEVRSIGVTELGFCSRMGEDLQAAAFAYCYYIIEDNEYIDSFLLNRQHDDKGALSSGLSLGIYNYDYSPKEIADVFKNIDSPEGQKYIQKMLKTIGEESFAEALRKAR